MDTIDPKVKSLVQAIKKAETGEGDTYNKKGASGEFGAYQFMPDTYKNYAQKYLGDANAQPTIENQNKIAYSFAKEKKDAGFNPAQIASMWNAGEGKPDAYKEGFKGTNDKGVQFDVPSYVQKVSQYYKDLSGQSEQKPEISIKTSEVVPAQGEEKVSFGKEVVRGLLKTPARLATNLVNAGQIALGKEQTQPFSGSLLGEVKPVGNTGNMGQDLKESVGAGLELSSYLVGGGGTKVGTEAALQGLKYAKPVLPQIAKASGIGALSGLMYGGGTSAAEGNSATKIAVDSLIGGVTGGAGGAIFGTLGAVLAKARGITNDTMNIVKKALSEDYEKSLSSTVSGRNILKDHAIGMKESLDSGLMPEIKNGRYDATEATTLLQDSMDTLGAARGTDIASNNIKIPDLKPVKERVLANVETWVKDPLEKQKVIKVVDDWFKALGTTDVDLITLNAKQVAAGVKARFQNETDATVRNAYRNIYHGLGEFINDSVGPYGGVNKQINQLLSRYHGVMDFLDAIHEKSVYNQNLSSMLTSEGARLGSTAIGSAVGGPGGAVVANVAYPVVEKTIGKIFGTQSSAYAKVMSVIREGEMNKINALLKQVQQNKGNAVANQIRRVLEEVKLLPAPIEGALRREVKSGPTILSVPKGKNIDIIKGLGI
jgi:hypothetical protein